MKPELSTRIQDYLSRKKPRTKVEHTEKVKVKSPSEYEQAKYDLNEAWEEFKDVCKVPIRIFKFIAFVALLVSFLWTLAVLDIPVNCSSSRECRKWMSK